MSKKYRFSPNSPSDIIATALTHCRTRPGSHQEDMATILRQMRLEEVGCETIGQANELLHALVNMTLTNASDRYLILCSFALVPGYEELNVAKRRNKYITETGFIGIGKSYEPDATSDISPDELKARRLRLEKNEEFLISEIAYKTAKRLGLEEDREIPAEDIVSFKNKLTTKIPFPPENEAPIINSKAQERTTSASRNTTVYNDSASDRDFFEAYIRNKATILTSSKSPEDELWSSITSYPKIPDSAEIPELILIPDIHIPLDIMMDEVRAFTKLMGFTHQDSDKEVSFEQMRKAIYELGDTHLQFYLTKQKDDNAYSPFHAVLAAEYFREAYRLGIAEAGYRVSYQYFHGIGLTKSEPEAFRWLELSSKGGYVTAGIELALCHEYGIATKKDHKKAEEVAYFVYMFSDLPRPITLQPVPRSDDPSTVQYPTVFGVPVNQLV